MQSKSVAYPSFLVYELIRLILILTPGFSETADAATRTWHASVPLLILAPVFLLMLALDESKFAHLLPILALIKALSGCSLLVYLFITVADHLATGSITAALDSLVISVFIVLADAVLGVYCFGRNRILCK
jgi:hypothetical protein